MKKKAEEENNKELKDTLDHLINGSMARIYLYRLAISEFSENLFIGIGPIGYQLKYETYPHNVILEIMSDFGLVGLIVFVSLMIYLVVSLIRFSRYNSCYIELAIIFFSQGVHLLLSGDLYNETQLIWIISFVLSLRAFGDNDKENICINKMNKLDKLA